MSLSKINKSVVTVRRGHLINSVFVNPGIYSCAVDAFLEISTHLFLPYLSNLRTRNGFTDLLFNVCSHYMSSREDSSLLREIRESVWSNFRQLAPKTIRPGLLAPHFRQLAPHVRQLAPTSTYLVSYLRREFIIFSQRAVIHLQSRM